MTTPQRLPDLSLIAQPATEDLQNALQILRDELAHGTREHFLTEAYTALSAAECLVTKALAKMIARAKAERQVAEERHPGRSNIVAPF